MNTLKIVLLILTLSTVSCLEKFESASEVDYKVIEIHSYANIINENTEPIIIKERNLIHILVNKKGECKIKKRIVEDSLIVYELKKYLIGDPENKNMPVMVEWDFEYAGKVVVNENFLIAANYDKELSYEKYQDIRHKIYVAFNEVRNEFSKKTFHKTWDELINSTDENDIFRTDEILAIFPFNYTEIKNNKN